VSTIHHLIYSFGSQDFPHADIATFQLHAVRIATAGVGLLIAGTMGEAIHLSHTERRMLINAARTALDDKGLSHVPLIAGTGAGSTRETIELCQEAAQAGADYAIVIASGYFAGLLTNNKKALKAFFAEVSEQSPIPVIIYNCGFFHSTISVQFTHNK
jgi:L-threo-3-deoxy-hexylosonate aldolase